MCRSCFVLSVGQLAEQLDISMMARKHATNKLRESGDKHHYVNVWFGFMCALLILPTPQLTRSQRRDQQIDLSTSALDWTHLGAGTRFLWNFNYFVWLEINVESEDVSLSLGCNSIFIWHFLLAWLNDDRGVVPKDNKFSQFVTAITVVCPHLRHTY